MKTIKSIAKLEAKFVIELSEEEARALDAFAYFGAYEATIKFVKTNWSNNINERQLKGFFETVHAELGPHIKLVDNARRTFDAGLDEDKR